MDLHSWRKNFDERQLKEIKLDTTVYDTDEYRHGTDGHNARLIIAKMAQLLDAYQTQRLAREQISSKSINAVNVLTCDTSGESYESATLPRFPSPEKLY